MKLAMRRPRVVSQSRPPRSPAPVEYARTRERALSFSNVLPLVVDGPAASELDHLGRPSLVRKNDQGGSVGPGRNALPTYANASSRKTSGAHVSPASPPPSSIAVAGLRRQKMSSA